MDRLPPPQGDPFLATMLIIVALVVALFGLQHYGFIAL